MTGFDRLGLIAYLARKVQGEQMGRTALMKYCYLLQTVRRVPLGYRFTLYSYGPFDSSVLTDLGNAEALGLVQSTLQAYPSGYGYRIKSLVELEEAEEFARDLVHDNVESIDWVLDNFGSKNVAELEMETTIVFVDQGASSKAQTLAMTELIRQVHEVKPHFSEQAIGSAAEELLSKGLLKVT